MFAPADLNLSATTPLICWSAASGSLVFAVTVAVATGFTPFFLSAVNTEFAAALAASVGSERVVAGIDTKNGRIAVKGWKAQVALTPDEAIPQLDPHVSAFLYTHVDGEGMMQGFPIETAARLRKLTERQLIVAGGIRSQQEVDALDALGTDAVVGMAVYTDLLKV